MTHKKLEIRLAEQMRQSGVNPTDIHRETGLARSSVYCIVKGTFLPSLKTVETLCNYLGCEPGDLLKMR